MSDSRLLIDMVAGIVGGVASVLVGQPLDTVKVKMQLFPNMYKGMFSCVKKTVAQQRFVGLYAGTVPALLSNCADNAVLFGTFGQSQKLVAKFADSNTKDLNWAQNAAAGTVSSVFTSLALCPTELVKIRMQGFDYTLDGSNEPKHLSVGKMARDIWKRGGYKGMYRGLWATLAREGLGSTAFFGTYELAREVLTPVGKHKDELNATTTMVSGALSGVAMWLVSYPMDVIKSRVQMSEKGINGGYRSVWSEIASVRALYSGLGPTLTKSVPVCSVLLFTVEMSKNFFYGLLSTSNPPTTELKLSSSSSDSPTTSGSPRNSGSPSSDSPPSDPSQLPKVPTKTADDEFFSFCDFISGWAAGIASTFVGHPIDTVKVVQQVTNSSVGKAIKDISNQNNFSGYFRGMMFPLLFSGLMNSVFFGVYGNTMRLIQNYRHSKDPSKNGDVRYCCDSENLHDNWHLDLFVSGCVGGVFYSLINIPGEVLKTMMQASSASDSKPKNARNGEKIEPPKINSPMKLVANLYKTYGIRSLYRGGTLLMIRDVPSMGIYVIAYEHFYCYLKKFDNSKNENKLVPTYVPVISGGVAGVLSWIFFLPIDVIKSKIIADSLTNPQYKSTWDCVKQTYRDGGSPRFFRGFWLLCIRAFPVNGLTFFVYEMVLKSCADEKMAWLSYLSQKVQR